MHVYTSTVKLNKIVKSITINARNAVCLTVIIMNCYLLRRIDRAKAIHCERLRFNTISCGQDVMYILRLQRLHTIQMSKETHSLENGNEAKKRRSD